MNENKPYTCFNDYPTHIQKEALKILEKDPLKYFKHVISQVHIGDEIAIELILLSIGSLFVENSSPYISRLKEV